MADKTLYYEFWLPEIGGDDGQWGVRLNYNWDYLDGLLKNVFDEIEKSTTGGLRADYQFEASTGAIPAAGYTGVNDLNPALVSEIRMSIFTENGNSIQTFLQELDEGDLMGFIEKDPGNAAAYWVLNGPGVLLNDVMTFPCQSTGTDPGSLPTQDARIDLLLLGNPQRQLPPGGDPGDLLFKQSTSNYDAEWEDPLLYFSPLEHPLYGANHSDVNTDDPIEQRHILAWNTQNIPVEFYPEYRMNWRGTWAQRTYYTHDVVLDQGYTMAAKKETNDRAAPQPVGDPVTSLPDVPMFQEYQTVAQVNSGHLYSFTKTGYFRGLRVWVPELSDTTNYNIVVVRNPNGSNPEYVSINDPILKENEWTTLGTDTTLVFAGEELLVYIDALNSGSSVSPGGTPADWIRQADDNNIDPTTGGWNTNLNDTVLRIHETTADTVPQLIDMTGVLPGSIFIFTATDNPNQSITFRAQTAETYLNNVYSWQVQIEATGVAGPPDPGQTCLVEFDVPLAAATKFVGMDAYWGPGSLPSFAGVVSNLQFNGVDQVVQGDEAYGVDIAFQEISISPDWDVVSLSSGGGGGEGGDPFPEAPPDPAPQPYGRDGILKDWVLVPEEVDTSAPTGLTAGRKDDRTWEPVYSITEADQTFIKLGGRLWEIDNSDRAVDWGDQILVAAPPSTLTLPIVSETQSGSIKDLVVWNGGNIPTDNVVLQLPVDHSYVFDGNTYSPLLGEFLTINIKPSEVLRVVARNIDLFDIFIDGAAKFDGVDTWGLVAGPRSDDGGSKGWVLADDGSWTPMVAAPTGGAIELEYDYLDNQAVPPGSGQVNLEGGALPSTASAVRIHMTTKKGNRLEQLWSTFQSGDIIWIIDQANAATYGFEISGPGQPDVPDDWPASNYVTFNYTNYAEQNVVPDAAGVVLSFLQDPNERIPAGGDEGWVLTKKSGADYDTWWRPTVGEVSNANLWSHARQWNTSVYEWTASPNFQGPVGIGTLSPVAPLQVYALPLDWNPSLTGGWEYTPQPNEISIYSEDDVGLDKYVGISLFPGDRTAGGQRGAARIVAVKENDGSQTGIAFWVRPMTTEAMRINASGNVGIGTSSPETPLQVGVHGGGYPVYGDSDKLMVARWGDCEMTIQSGSNNGGYLNFADQDQKRAGWIRYHHLGDQMYIGVNGSTRMFITADGNVGIGTTSPEARLHVEGGSVGLKIGTRTQGTQTDIELVANANISAPDSLNLITGPTGYFRFFTGATSPATGQTGATERVRIDSAGNVGIGSSSPQEKLYVVGNIYTYAGWYGIGNAVFTDYGEIPTYGMANNAGAQNHVGMSGWDGLTFYTRQARRMTITSAGYVGIGTTNPSAELHLDGGQLLINDDGLCFVVDSTAYNSSRWYRSGVEYVRFQGGSGNFYMQSPGDITFQTGGSSARMTITSAGNVGIGTTVPAPYMLNVRGDVNLDGAYNYYIDGVPIETFVDAPSDGNTYGRNNGNWVQVSGGGGTVSNLASSPTTTQVTITNTGGDNAVIAQASSTIAGVMTTAHHDKLDGIQDNANNYTHPTYTGDDFSIDTGPLTGAVVVSDIDINVTTDGTGHVTDANGNVSTRTLTLVDLGYTGDTDANKYVHPTHPGDDASVDTGHLSGAWVIDDLDFNITTDTLGHVTDANATVGTRQLTAEDIGAISVFMEAGAESLNLVGVTGESVNVLRIVIGNLVIITGKITWSTGGSGSSPVYISGFTYDCDWSTGFVPSVKNVSMGGVGAPTTIVARMAANSTSVYLYEVGEGGNETALNYNKLESSGEICLNFSYYSNATPAAAAGQLGHLPGHNGLGI